MTEQLSASQYEEERLKKLRRIAELGLDPWGRRYPDHQPIGQARDAFKEETPDDAQPTVRVAGRIVAMRNMGKVVFADLWDWTGRVQIYLGKKQIGEEAWEVVRATDLGDLVGVEGRLGKTRTGEITIFADRCDYLAKMLAVPPEKWHGLKDIELRYRQRYLDLVHNEDVMDTFLLRSRLIQTVRDYFRAQGFVEVETPTMQPIVGGAAARPFETYHNTLGIPLYMRIAPELYLKRLLVGGMERVFEIGRMYRNEGLSPKHNPEFTMMEAYQAYGDYNDMMDHVERLIGQMVEVVGKGDELPWGDDTTDFTLPWPRRTYADLVRELAGVDPADADAVREAAGARGLETEGKHSDVILNDLFEEVVEPSLTNPTFVIDYPASLCPLTKRKVDDPGVAERFELFIQGTEIANAYTELNDPLLQEELFRVQLDGQDETMATMDEDFVLALKHAMPPAGGLGMGIDRLVMLLANRSSIRDVILFPQLRPGKGRSGPKETGFSPAESEQEQ